MSMSAISYEISYKILPGINESGISAICSNQSESRNQNSNLNASIGLVKIVLTSLILGVIILSTIFGNGLVITAVLTERSLRNFVANYLIASLAIADLLVALLVMPLAAVNEVTSKWILGSVICDLWTSFDVLCCTSSILHLVAIAVDRYLAVTRADYIHRRSISRIFLVVTLSWTLSFIISVPPLLGWRSGREGRTDLSLPDSQCLISQDKAYTIYSTLGAFYLPLLFIIVLYGKIYRVARYRIYHMQFRRRKVTTPVEQSNHPSHKNPFSLARQSTAEAGPAEARLGPKQSVFSFPIYGHECEERREEEDDCCSRDSSRMGDYDDVRGFDDDDDDDDEDFDDESSFMNSDESRSRDCSHHYYFINNRGSIKGHQGQSKFVAQGNLVSAHGCRGLSSPVPRHRRQSVDKESIGERIRKKRKSQATLTVPKQRMSLDLRRNFSQNANPFEQIQKKSDAHTTQPAIRALARRSLKLFSEYTRVAMNRASFKTNRMSKSEGKLYEPVRAEINLDGPSTFEASTSSTNYSNNPIIIIDSLQNDDSVQDISAWADSLDKESINNQQSSDQSFNPGTHSQVDSQPDTSVVFQPKVKTDYERKSSTKFCKEPIILINIVKPMENVHSTKDENQLKITNEVSEVKLANSDTVNDDVTVVHAKSFDYVNIVRQPLVKEPDKLVEVKHQELQESTITTEINSSRSINEEHPKTTELKSLKTELSALNNLEKISAEKEKDKETESTSDPVHHEIGSSEAEEKKGHDGNDQVDSGKIGRRRLSLISLARVRRRRRRADSDSGESPGSLKRALARRYAKQREKARGKERKKERKAARTLAIVTGSFIVCWLPFFVVAILRPFCRERCHYPPYLISFVLWLGYFNSLLNPIIYTVFNRDFRTAFKRILTGTQKHPYGTRRVPLCFRCGGYDRGINLELMGRAKKIGRRKTAVLRGTGRESRDRGSLTRGERRSKNC